MMRKWQEVKKAEVRYREYFMEDADFAIVAFGSAGRVCFSAVLMARAAGLKVGLIRPVTVNPFPEAVIEEISRQVDGMLVVEMNGGQMLNDVLLYSRSRVPVNFYGRPGGMVPFPDEVMAEIEFYMKHPVAIGSDPRIPWLERMGSLN
jgi:2-oxoglutarate ferredoxin oxidoreductase subunit alpha